MIARLIISTSQKLLKEEIEKSLDLHLGSHNINHPDILYFASGEKLGIAQAKIIKEHFSLKPYSAKGRMVILEDASTLTTEAQNALLKTLEELPSEALLILGSDSDSRFLPTLLSRSQIIRLSPKEDLEEGKQSSYPDDIEKLLSANIDKRFEYVEKLKDREVFLHSLTLFFHKLIRKQAKKEHEKYLKELIQAEGWAAQNVNLRAILEYLMLVMPTK